MNDSLGERADAQHPWIGLASFTEGDRGFFAGRGDEIEDLLRLVRRDTLTLLYGAHPSNPNFIAEHHALRATRREPFSADKIEAEAQLARYVERSDGVLVLEAVRQTGEARSRRHR